MCQGSVQNLQESCGAAPTASYAKRSSSGSITISCAVPSPVEPEPADDHGRDAVGLAAREVGGGGDLVGDRRPGSRAARSRSRSVVPRRSRIGGIPATPIATSVVPWRNGRPNESVTTTPTVRPVSSRSASRMPRALASGSSGSSTSVPGSGAFEWSTPAEAQTKPCRVSVITSGAALADDRASPRARIDLDLARVALARRRARTALVGGLDVVEPHDAALGLRDRLLRDDEHVAVLELGALRDERGEIVALRGSPAGRARG